MITLSFACLLSRASLAASRLRGVRVLHGRKYLALFLVISRALLLHNDAAGASRRLVFNT